MSKMEKRERIADYITNNEELSDYDDAFNLPEDWYEWSFQKKLDWVNNNVLKTDNDVRYYFEKYLNKIREQPA